MRKKRIAIVEDELLIAHGIQMDLEARGYVVLQPICKSVEEAETMLRGQKPDLLLIDIRLEGKRNGIDLAKLINAQYRIPFVFLTSHLSREVMESVKSENPAGFLTKPYIANNLFVTIEMAFHYHSSRNISGHLQVKERQGVSKVAYADILYLAADGMYVKLILKDREITLRKTLSELLEELPAEQFIQVHRSYVANIHQVLSIGRAQIWVLGHEIPMSRAHRPRLAARFMGES